MKILTSMPKHLESFYQDELNKAQSEMEKNDLQKSWYHLERAHILGQPYPIEHTSVHWKMFLFGIKIKNIKEIKGQIPRLIFGGIKSFVGIIPVGNTGGANVPALKPMEIPQDLQAIIKKINNNDTST